MGYKRELVNDRSSKLRSSKKKNKKCIGNVDLPQLHLDRRSANAIKIYSENSRMDSSYKEGTDSY